MGFVATHWQPCHTFDGMLSGVMAEPNHTAVKKRYKSKLLSGSTVFVLPAAGGRAVFLKDISAADASILPYNNAQPVSSEKLSRASQT
jgi:hypothetical protein